ncbi:MAG: hypothetical protein NNA23_00395 [Nitrospira sp.]|nr:hypothetical protein [Nitrospira sp.]MCP9464919.1 hypothetical protein [Nitrospira sp.]
MNRPLLLASLGCIVLLWSAPLSAGPLEGAEGAHPDQELLRAIHQAAHEVDEAWDVYHRAALGGTVASPELQSSIEDHLHEARTLITQALEAVQQRDHRAVEHLLRLVRIHTTQAIEGSQEPKQ